MGITLLILSTIMLNQNQHTTSQNQLIMNQNLLTTLQRFTTTPNLDTRSRLTGPPWKRSLECTQLTTPIQSRPTTSLPLPTTRLNQHTTHLSRPMLHPNPSPL